MSRKVYLDHNASTPVHPDVVAEMMPYFQDVFGNPSSVHGFGRAARDAVDVARERIARFLAAAPDEIVFTSGGTESDNFGVKGLALARGRGHVITSKIEHHAVLRTCQTLEGQGFDVTYLPVDEHGMVSADDVKRAIRPDTIAISVMHANSEIGTIQPVAAIGELAREHGVPFHVDAVQTFGKIPIDLHGAGIDVLSFSGHKIYGPKATAGLYIRKGPRLVPTQHGVSESIVLGLDLKGVAASAGSACTAGHVEPSHVLVAMGLPLDWAMGAVRFSLGRTTTADDIDYVVDCLEALVRKLRLALPAGPA